MLIGDSFEWVLYDNILETVDASDLTGQRMG